MLEKNFLDLDDRISRLEDWSREVTEAFNSYNTYLNDISEQLKYKQQSEITKSGLQEIKIENEENRIITVKSNATTMTVAPDENEIKSFRSKLLKPIPKDEIKRTKEPTSIRAALIQEMKEFFGTGKKEENRNG